MKKWRSGNRWSTVIFSLIWLTASVLGGAGDVDPGFAPSAVRTNGSNLPSLNLQKFVRQPDGKILVAGSFNVIGGRARAGIARLNADGTVDDSFVPPKLWKFVLPPTNLFSNSTIFGIGLQPDGKVWISGDFIRVDGLPHARLARLNSDGFPDVEFNNNLHQNLLSVTGLFYDIEPLPNGKVLLGGDFDFLAPPTVRRIGGLVRLNADGSFDDTFAQTLNQGAGMDVVYKVHPMSDGKILVGGLGSLIFNRVGLARLHEDGLIDFSFTGVSATGAVLDFEVLPNDQTIIGGTFTLVNGFPNGRIARINSNGFLDTSFNTNNNGAISNINSVEQVAGGKLVIGGSFLGYNGASVPRIIRLNADGTQDKAFDYTAFNDGPVNAVLVMADSRLLIGGTGGFWDKISILNADGSPGVQAENLIGMSGLVRTTALQPDGKILVGGRFASANGVERQNIVRFNGDGSLDTSFDGGFPFNEAFFIVNKLLVLPDGKILVGSDGSGPNQTSPLMRLDSSGALDPSFDSGIAAFSKVTDIVALPGGKLLVAGNFSISGTNRKLARLNSDGTLDTSFNEPQIDDFVDSILIQPDGKLLIAGAFGQVNGNNRGKIARLNEDGTFDPTFNPPGGANGIIWDTALQSDGKIVLAGDFTGLNGDLNRVRVGRLNGDGSLDATFSQQANGTAYGLAIEADGKILLGGQMTEVGGLPRSGLTRLNTDGTVDPTFQVGSGTDGPVWGLDIQPDGSILAVGEFTTYNESSRISIVKIKGGTSASGSTMFDFDGDGRADISVFRPTSNIWYQLLGINYQFSFEEFGAGGDVVAPADYDGDGKTDLGMFRPGTGEWWYKSSISGNQVSAQWGQSGDTPRPSDFDGDGIADLVLYRASNFVWYRFGSTGLVSIKQFGALNDQPVIGDFDGDGKSDLAIFRPSSGDWWWESSVDGIQKATGWGIETDVPAPGDFDGDEITDFAVFRPSNGAWYILNSGTGNATIVPFGTIGDRPVPADYDGDGKTDIAVYRPNTGEWYLLRSTEGFAALSFGISSDIPIPNAFIQ